MRSRRSRLALALVLLCPWPIFGQTLPPAPAPASAPAPELPAASSAAGIKPPGDERPSFQFVLLPKTFQSRPLLDFNVLTEMTDEGRKVAPPSPENPVYYVAQPGKFLQLGISPPAGERPPPIELLEQAMREALAAGGYRANAPPGRAPSLMVVFNYGSHTPSSEASGLTAEDKFLAMMGNVSHVTDLLDRAALIGGVAFAAELKEVLEHEALNIAVGHPVFPAFASPLWMYLKSAKNRLLAEEIVEDVFHPHYFVVASAYDYAAGSQGRRVLLWRTKMTVDADGINMRESLAPLIATAGPYFGREMKEMTVLAKRISREGKVEVGTASVVEDHAPPSEKTAAPGAGAKREQCVHRPRDGGPPSAAGDCN